MNHNHTPHEAGADVLASSMNGGEMKATSINREALSAATRAWDEGAVAGYNAAIRERIAEDYEAPRNPYRETEGLAK